MFHTYNGHLWGMHLIWWIIWIFFVFWIFITPWKIPGQKTNKNSPLGIIKKRFASGEITSKEFEEMKKLIEKK